MLIIKVKEDEKIDKALKTYKDKFSKNKIMKELKDRKNFKKKSEKRRDELKKAVYIQKIKDLEQD